MNDIFGAVSKLKAQLDEQGVVNYNLPLGENLVALNPLIGKKITLTFLQKITCSHCGKKTNKSYSQGYCYPCMQKLAQCDMCIMKPETCHFDKGTCREPQWGETHCMTDHYVYLSNTSGLKVGITRHTQLPTRWIDQGATQALAIFKVSTRLQSGLVEIALAKYIADKTNWQAMLKGEPDQIDLQAQAEKLKPLVNDALADIRLQYGENSVVELSEKVVNITYPVTAYLPKIKAYNLDKTPQISDVLIGIKGQYLIFESGVINMRKYSSYHLSIEF